MTCSEVRYATAEEVVKVFGPDMAVMPVECAWCRADMGFKAGFGAVGKTSGICSDCFEKFMLSRVGRCHETQSGL